MAAATYEAPPAGSKLPVAPPEFGHPDCDGVVKELAPIVYHRPHRLKRYVWSMEPTLSRDDLAQVALLCLWMYRHEFEGVTGRRERGAVALRMANRAVARLVSDARRRLALSHSATRPPVELVPLVRGDDSLDWPMGAPRLELDRALDERPR